MSDVGKLKERGWMPRLASLPRSSQLTISISSDGPSFVSDRVDQVLTVLRTNYVS
jgi:hypothetical protein